MEPNSTGQTPTGGDGTGGGAVTPPAATPPANNPAGATDGETVTIKKSDYQNLVSARDRNANNASEAEKRFSRLEGAVEPILVERELKSFLSDNKSDYPDVTVSDLEDVQSLEPEYLKAQAAKIQTRLQQHAQNTIKNIEHPPKPQMTEEQRAAEEKQLRDGKGPGRLARMLSLRSR